MSDWNNTPLGNFALQWGRPRSRERRHLVRFVLLAPKSTTHPREFRRTVAAGDVRPDRSVSVDYGVLSDDLRARILEIVLPAGTAA